MDINDKIDLITMDSVEEAFRKVVRKGKIKRKLVCPAGMKASGGKCVLMKPSEKRNRFKAAVKRGRELKANIGVQKQANRKRAKSLRKRAMAIPNSGAPSLKTTGTKGE